MKKHIRPIVCSLAAIMIATPLAACGEKDDSALLPPAKAEEFLDLPVQSEPAAGEPEVPPMPEVEPPLSPEVPTVTETPTVPEEPKAAQAKYICIRTDGLNIRKGAGTNYAVLGTAQKSTLLSYVGKTGNWYETKYKNGTAYVSADGAHTSITLLTEGEAKAERVIEEGLSTLGVPYVYGATRLHDGSGRLLKGFTTSKFDCSSLMQYIFYEGADVLLNTTTRTQVTQGKEVAKDEIRRGDLLFFTNASRKNNTGIERVGHVALYLGDNYILHTASDFAKIEQISATRWSYYITARRVI
ncbi:MAG: C40 family peptidase [Clostridiales bacterium]|nr:C40 family peptidase [Clostridiales bacterium]